MALTITYRASIYSTSAAASYATSTTYTPAANSLIVCFVIGCSTSVVDPNAATPFAGHGASWTKLTLTANGLSTTHALSVWVADAGASPSTAACTAAWGTNRTGGVVIEFEVTGWGGTSAANAIIQNLTATGTGTTGTVNQAAVGNSNNRPMAFWCHLANEATTPRANWTETAGADGNFNNPATGAEGEFRSDAFETAATATWAGNVEWRGVALEIRAQNTGTQTTTGKARIQVTGTQTTTGKAAIRATGTQTITGKARLQVTGTQTITGKARIQATGTQTTTGKAAIQVTTTQTITGMARIQITGAQTIGGTARIQATGTQTITGKANIQATSQQTIPGTARIQTTSTQTIAGRASIAPSRRQPPIIAGVRSLLAFWIGGATSPSTTTQQAIDGKAWIQTTATQTITGKGRIQATATQTIAGKANIVGGVGSGVLPDRIVVGAGISLLSDIGANIGGG